MAKLPKPKIDEKLNLKESDAALMKINQSAFEYDRDVNDKFHISPDVINNCSLHFHNQIELLAIQSGNGQPVKINDTEEILYPGDIAIADSFDIHAYTYTDTISTVLIIPSAYLRDFEQYKQKRLLATNFIHDKSVFDKCFPLLKEIVSTDNELIQKGLVNTLLGNIVEATGLSNERTELSHNMNFIREILDYIELHYAENITLANIAAHFSYSPSHFSRLFNNYFRYSITDYVNMVRTRKFFELKETNPNKPLIDLIMESGFSSVPTFYRLFSKKFGVSPLKYFQTQ